VDQQEQILYTFQWSDENPTIEKLVEKLNISRHYIDLEYGIVLIDDIDHTYCILVDKQGVPNLNQGESSPEGTTFSNPRIAPFDLEEE